MADVSAFRAWRYDLAQVGSLAEVTAPPYDVIGAEQQKQLYERHPCNVIRLILNRTEPGDADADERYRRAAGFLRHWQSEGVLIREHENALYAYHQEFDWEGRHYVRRGFLGRLRLEEFGQGSVFPHEQTMSGPKADRLALTKACRMNLSPIFGLYPDDGGSVQQPLESAIAGVTPLEATDDLGVVHRLWPVTDQASISAVSRQLRSKTIFIADGHHRYETALNYRNWLASEGNLGEASAPPNFVLMHFVGMGDPGLAILPTHRLVSFDPQCFLSADRLAELLSRHFAVERIGEGPAAAREAWEMMEIEGRQDVFALAAASDRQWLLARLTDDSPMQQLAAEHSDAWRALGVSLLHKLVIEHLLADVAGSGESEAPAEPARQGPRPPGSAARPPRTTPECRYVHLLDEVNAALDAGACQLACLVAPAGIEHVREIASGFEKMPPKSTYFYPKLLSGLVFHGLDEP